MNSLILCEGSSDFVLLQYYMEKAYHWEDRKNNSTRGIYRFSRGEMSRRFFRSSDTLTITSVGGVSNMQKALKMAIDRNSAQGPGDEVFEKIIIFTDHDEQDTPEKRTTDIAKCLSDCNVTFDSDVDQLQFTCTQMNDMGVRLAFNIKILLVPDGETGALESFLLKSIASENPYDGVIISKGHDFVADADPDERYLKHRGQKIKAEFDVYFSIRTSSKQFTQRRDIIKNVPWEELSLVHKEFEILGEL